MSGFPARILRQVLGPLFKDPKPVENPEIEIAANKFNLLCYTAIGSGLMVPRASIAAKWTGSQFVYVHQEEAWNPKHAQPHPTLARESAGVYSYTFDAEYLDMDDNVVATNIDAPRVVAIRDLGASFVIGDVPGAYAWIDADHPLVVQVRTWTGSTLTDFPFWLEVL